MLLLVVAVLLAIIVVAIAAPSSMYCRGSGNPPCIMTDAADGTTNNFDCEMTTVPTQNQEVPLMTTTASARSGVSVAYSPNFNCTVMLIGAIYGGSGNDQQRAGQATHLYS